MFFVIQIAGIIKKFEKVVQMEARMMRIGHKKEIFKARELKMFSLFFISEQALSEVLGLGH